MYGSFFQCFKAKCFTRFVVAAAIAEYLFYLPFLFSISRILSVFLPLIIDFAAYCRFFAGNNAATTTATLNYPCLIVCRFGGPRSQLHWA